MKSQDTKRQFIELRAEGLSYSKIAETLHISKSTCSEWERELRDAVAEQRQERLGELYTSYGMTKEARIKKLGEALERVDKALESADLTEVPPEKLLDYKLKYTEALKGEYTGSGTPYTFSDKLEPKEIVHALGDLLNRIRAGEVTPEQATKESSVIANLLKAYDTVEVKTKLDALEAIVGGRA